MDRLRELVQRISERLRVLTVSQRLAVGLCAALVGVSILWLTQWSARPELVELVPYKFSFDELSDVEKVLKASGQPYEIRGTRVYVRVADQPGLIRQLNAQDALPEGSLYGMDELLVDQNPFVSPEQRRFAQNYAKGNELAKIIATYDGVKHARVLINPETKRRFGGFSDVPTASVAITMGSGRTISQAMVGGVAKLVAGAVPGLKPHNVFITDQTGRAHRVPHPDEAVGAGYLDEVKKRESHLLSKIMDKLSYIPGVRASVTVALDMDRKTTENIRYAKPEVKRDSSEESTTAAGGGASEPGVQANLGAAITAGGGETSSKEKSETENFPSQIALKETIQTGPYAMKSVTATVSIPRSFIVGLYKLRLPGTEDPSDTDQAFKDIRDAHLAEVAASVSRIVMARPEDVRVDVYTDMSWTSDGDRWVPVAGAMPGAMPADATGGAVAFVKAYGPQLGLGVLAMMSMFMMTRVVRKSSQMLAGDVDDGPQQVVRDDEGRVLTVGPQTVGQAETTEGFLTGKEVDEDTLKYRQLGEEVSRLVTEDPRSAAELIRRWIEESG
ncbi:MAG: flagellar M-ring protein FliF C-terminal domain-containing protein [Phycisphaerae bacterium]